MEQPYQGRATILDNLTDLQIIIPAKRNLFLIFFLGIWLILWLLGATVAFATGTGLLGDPPKLFILFWLVGWLIGGLFAFRIFLWNLRGKEIITVGQGRLTIDKRGALFSKAKVYDLNEIRDMRVQDDIPAPASLLGNRYIDLRTFNLGGTIRFDYGLRTVKFADSMDEAEAKFIVSQIKDRHLLTEHSYS